MSIIQQVPWTVQPQGPGSAAWPVPAQIVFNPRAGYSNLSVAGSSARPAPVGAAVLTPWQGEVAAKVGSSAGADRVAFGAPGAFTGNIYSGLVRFWTTTSSQAFFLELGAGGCFEIAGNGTSIALDKAAVSVIVSSSNAFVLNGWNTVAFSVNTTTGRNAIALNGVLTTSATTVTLNAATDVQIGKHSSSLGQLQYTSCLIVSNREVMDQAFLTRVSRSAQDVWGLFAPQTRRIWVPVSAGGGSTGTLATTNANDTSAASGTTTVTGTLAKTNANDTVSASGTTTVTGTLAATNANDTVSASGIAGAASGTVAYTNANDTVAAAGWAGTITGTSATTNANDSVAAAGPVTGNTVDAGKRKRKPILIEVQGRIQEFETQAAADAYLASLEPAQEKRIEAKARRIARAVISSGNAFVPPVFAPVQVISGPEDFKAAVNMRAALTQSKLNEAVRAQIAREMHDRDDEDHAVAVMLLM